jgi:hypothetical protein
MRSSLEDDDYFNDEPDGLDDTRYGGGMDEYDEVMSDALDMFNARHDAGRAAVP